MKKYILFSLIFMFHYVVEGQIITVLDSETKQVLPFSYIINENGEDFIITNSKGQADISNYHESPIIVVTHNGYEKLNTNFNQMELNSFIVALNPKSVSLNEIVISANRQNQWAGTVPSRVVNINLKELNVANSQTSADLLGASGRVFIQKSQQAGGSPMIRGFATNRLLYSVDGVRMNNAIFRGGNIQNVISIDPFSMEKVEILFGPASVIYGSDAIGGVMSLNTLSPDLSTDDKALISGNASFRYSSANNENTGHFDIKAGWGKWAFVTSVSSFDFDNLRMGNNGPREYLRPFYVQRQNNTDVIITNGDKRIQNPTAYSQVNLMQKIRLMPAKRFDFQYGFHFSETSEYSRYDRHIRYKSGLPTYGEWNYGPQLWLMHNLKLTHSVSNIFYDELIFNSAIQKFEESRISRDFNKIIRETRNESVNAYSVNIDLQKRFSEKGKISYGGEYILNNVNSTGINTDISSGNSVTGPSRYPKAYWASYAAYMTGFYEISSVINATGGIRYNQYLLNAEFDTTFYNFPFTKANSNNGAFTGSLGTVYKPDDKTIFNLNFSTAFRAPNVDDIGKVFDSAPGIVVVPNPDLKAEYAYNADIGLLKKVGKNLKFDLSAYYTVLSDAMVRRDFKLNGQDSIMYSGEFSRVQALQNAASASVYGIMGGFECKIGKKWTIMSDINFQKGNEELDDGSTSPLRHAPPLFGQTKLLFSDQKISIQLSCNYSANVKNEGLPEEEKLKTEIYAIDEQGKPYSPSWYSLNLKAIFTISENITASSGIENITDQLYKPYSSGIAMAGRNFVFSLHARL